MTETNGATVIDHAIPVSAYTRTDQTRRAVRHHRDRARRGIHRLTIDLTDTQLNRLEERGYLDENLRGSRPDKAEALETFIGDFL